MRMKNSLSLTEEIRLFLLNVSEARYQSLNIQDRVWNHWIITHVLQGEVEMTTCGKTILVQSGDVMIHPPNIPFNETNPSGGVHQVIFLDASLSSNIDLFTKYPVSSVVSLQDSAAFAKVFQELLHYWKDKSFYEREFYLFNTALRLVGEIITSWISAGRQQRHVDALMQNRFQEMEDYIHARIQEKITRNDLAELLHLHPNYFDRVFLKHYHITPMRLLRSLRLKKAKELLESTDSTLETIAVQCGLGGAAYLSNVFVREYEMTPGEYRKKMKSIISMYDPSPG